MEKKKKARQRPTRQPKVAYAVTWDPDGQRFIAVDEKGTLLGLSATRSLALGIARTAAIKASELQEIQVTVMVAVDGKLKE